MKSNRNGSRKQSVFQGYAWQSMEEHLPQDLVLEYKDAFQVLDKEKTGKISLRDLSMVIFSIGINLTEAELLEFVSRVVDLDKLSFTEGFLGFPEFLAIITFVITDCVTEKEAARIFREFDKDGDGYISTNELRDVMIRLGDDISDDEVQEMIKEADKDGDGRVSLEEFILVMNSAHSSCSESHSEHIPLPRILIDEKEQLKERNEKPATMLHQSSFDDVQLLSTIGEETPIRSDRELHFIRKNSIADRRSSLGKTSTKKKSSIIAWLKFTENHSGSVNTSSNSSLNSNFPSESSSGLKKRRKSSITRTLRSGRDALIATARTLRRISR